MNTQPSFHPELKAYILELAQEQLIISADRKATLDELAQVMATHWERSGGCSIIVICTHNSRRSHIGQLWFQSLATWFGLQNMQSYSGGTEATAFNPKAREALERAGFRFEVVLEDEQNPRIWGRCGQHNPGRLLFSKKFDDAANPRQNFIALMVCDEAAEACPFVPGATVRLSLPYPDPKHEDGTPGETAAYDKAVRDIGRELYYVMERVAAQVSNSNPSL
jgi:arsenate reductase